MESEVSIFKHFRFCRMLQRDRNLANKNSLLEGENVFLRFMHCTAKGDADHTNS
jgi:hypothetical protein